MWPWEEDLEKWVTGWRDRFERSLQDDDRIWETLQGHWQEWAGDLLEPMLVERHAAVQSLSHRDAGVRRCAASVLLHHWSIRPGEEGSEGIYRLAIGDPDRETRVIAVRALGNCYENTDDVAVGSALALIVRDEGHPPILRTFAYHALFNLRGLPIRCIRPTASAPGEQPRPPHAPEDVDWSFVGSFLVEGRVPTPTESFSSMPEADRPLVRCYAAGHKAYRLGKHEEAVSAFSETIRLEPRLVQLYYLRARSLSRLERFDDAIRDLAFVIKSWPDWARAYDERAHAYEGKGRTRRAAADRKAAAKIRRRGGKVEDASRSDSAQGTLAALSETDRRALCGYIAATTAYERGEYKQALALVNEALTLRGDAAWGYLLRARVHANLEELDDAIADFTRVIELNPFSPRAYYERGEVFTRKGLTALARADYESAERLGKES